jgi:hypothetical protein
VVQLASFFARPIPERFGIGPALAVPDAVLKASFALALGVVLTIGRPAALLAAEIRPGDALPTEELPPEAQRYEAALQGQALDAEGNTVVERRRFDARAVQLGLGTGLGMPTALLGGYAELTPWDRLSFGVEAGLTFWGPAGGGYVRLRPIVWGGEGRRLLNAFVFQASYTVMRDGEIDLMPCVDSCRTVHYLDRTAQVAAISAGFEHQLASGWSIRYDFGVGHALFATAWKCASYDDGKSAPCRGEPPGDDLPLFSFAVGHTL